MRRGGDGDMPLARQHARGDVEADPAGARQIDLGPGVQVGEVALDLARAFDRIDVGAKLDQVAGDETGGEAEMPQDLDQQPGGVAAGAAPSRQRLFRRLNARLHADDIANLFLQIRVELDQEIDGRIRLPRNLLQVRREQRTGLFRLQIWREFRLQVVGVLERKGISVGLDKEVERIDHGHLRGEIDLDFQFGRLLGEDVAREPIALRVLLPVYEMVRRRNLERITQDRRARVWRRAQANGLGAEVDRAVISVMRDVMQCDVDRHGAGYSSSFFEQNTGQTRDQALTNGMKCLRERRTSTKLRVAHERTNQIVPPGIPARDEPRFDGRCQDQTIPTASSRS